MSEYVKPDVNGVNGTFGDGGMTPAGATTLWETDTVIWVNGLVAMDTVFLAQNIFP